MEVKPGYNLTEVGVIPEDWEVAKLGHYAAFKTGPFGSSLHKSDYVHGGVPVVNPMQIVDGTIQPTITMTITEQAARRLSDFQLRAGDIVIGRRGEMGRCAYVTVEHQGWLCGTGSMIVRPSATADGRFLQRVLSSPPVIAEIENASVGSTMINLNQGTLGNLLIPLPPTKAEQQVIAEALSDADALTASLEQLIDKKRQLKQGAMQELLTGKKRLPGFSGEWKTKRLGEIATKFLNGGTPSTSVSEYWKGNIPWITGAEVVDQQVAPVRRCISAQAVKNSATNVVERGTLLIVTRTGVGKLAIAPFDVAISQDLTGIYLNSEVAHPEYVFRYFDYNKDKLAALNQGTSIAGITRETLTSLPVALPTVSEQRAIAAVLSDMDAEIAALEKKLGKARQIKQGMMQDLLTGRIRLV